MTTANYVMYTGSNLAQVNWDNNSDPSFQFRLNLKGFIA